MCCCHRRKRSCASGSPSARRRRRPAGTASGYGSGRSTTSSPTARRCGLAQRGRPHASTPAPSPRARPPSGSPRPCAPGAASECDIVQTPEPTAETVAAGVLLFDEQDRVLLVDPTYKPGWEFPGGVVEAGRGPARAGHARGGRGDWASSLPTRAPAAGRRLGGARSRPATEDCASSSTAAGSTARRPRGCCCPAPNCAAGASSPRRRRPDCCRRRASNGCAGRCAPGSAGSTAATWRPACRWADSARRAARWRPTAALGRRGCCPGPSGPLGSSPRTAAGTAPRRPRAAPAPRATRSR